MSDALLVPVAVEGLVANPPVRSQSKFLRWHIDYTAMKSLKDPLPDPWQNKDRDPPELGIHLRWNLPRALTRGETKDQTQNVKFPIIPNRWLIVRLGAPTPSGITAPRPAKAWIVESDYTGSDGANSFAAQQGTEIVYTRVGRCYELAKAPQLFHSSNAPGFLTAVGPGDVSFSAYQPDMQSVLSFHDPVTDVAEGTSLTYLVAGWFANLGDDPLNGITTIDALKKRLDELRWSLQTGAAVPARTIVHGMLQEVTWQTTSAPMPPEPSTMSVAVGHTAIDALAALVAKWAKDRGSPDGAKLEQRLQAFQYDMFDVLDEHGAAALQVNIRRGWFGQTPGGTMWSLEPVTGDVPGATPPVPNDAQRQWLAKLNRDQQRLDDTLRVLRTLQAELYELWWKKRRIDAMTEQEVLTQRRQFSIEIRKLRDQLIDLLKPDNPAGIVKAVQDQLNAAAALAYLPDPSSTDSIGEFEKKMPEPRAPFRLKPATEPPFEAPVDPVLLVAGVAPPPGSLDMNERIPCRLTSQTVTGVTVGGTAFTESTGTIAQAMPRIDLTKLPSDLGAPVAALMREAFFVDPSDAPAIAWCGAGWRDSAALAAAMRNRTAQTASIAKPLEASFAFAKWMQAWSPLHLAWQVQWHSPIGNPTGPQGQNDWRGPGMDTFPADMAQWSFDGRDGVRARGSEYFVWNGAQPKPKKSYSGLSLLTPQTTLLFIDRLRAHLRTHPDADLQKIQELIDAVGATHFLSQALPLNQRLVARRHQHSLTPPGADLGLDIAALVGNETETVPDVALGDQRPYVPGTDTAAFFFPVRAGYFTIEQLLLVDAFGQYVDLIQANGNARGTTLTFHPVRGQGLTPDATATLDRPGRFLKKAPRVVQPSRVRMRLIDASDDTRDVGLSENANPVCGWLVHNFLDRSLAFYSPDGIAIGDLVLTGNAAQPDVAWIAAPIIRGADGNPVTPPPLNIRARAFRDQLLARSDRGPAFQSLLTIIDQRVGTIDHGSDPGDPDLAVLVGRPLALLRARVDLQLYGIPSANTSWRSTPVGTKDGRASWDTAARQIADFTSIPFSIRLGTEELRHDGVIGYFDAGETIFNSVRAPQTATPYIRKIGDGNYVNLKLAGDTSRNLTLLADPRATVHATSGILPTAALSIPAEHVDGPLRRMAFTFRTGPILSTRDSIRLPRPAEQHGDWLWLRRTSTSPSEPCDTSSIIDGSEEPRLTERPRAIDGWLQFTPSPRK